MVVLKTPDEIELMAEAGRRLAKILTTLKREVRAGVTTAELDQRAAKMIKEAGCTPAFLGYRPQGARKAYPATLCVSINDVVVHGVPSQYLVRDGDLVKLDLGLVYEGFYVDAAVTIGVGSISSRARKLIAVTREALERGIREARPGKHVGDIGWAIEQFVMRQGLSVVHALTGHGIGRKLHEEPHVPNFGKRGEGIELVAGMVLAIEPMLSAGLGGVYQLTDESYATRDGSLSAHFEHTVAITEKRPRVLTKI